MCIIVRPERGEVGRKVPEHQPEVSVRFRSSSKITLSVCCEKETVTHCQMQSEKAVTLSLVRMKEQTAVVVSCVCFALKVNV
jgi:hypothetical protein